MNIFDHLDHFATIDFMEQFGLVTIFGFLAMCIPLAFYIIAEVVQFTYNWVTDKNNNGLPNPITKFVANIFGYKAVGDNVTSVSYTKEGKCVGIEGARFILAPCAIALTIPYVLLAGLTMPIWSISIVGVLISLHILRFILRLKKRFEAHELNVKLHHLEAPRVIE